MSDEDQEWPEEDEQVEEEEQVEESNNEDWGEEAAEATEEAQNEVVEFEAQEEEAPPPPPPPAEEEAPAKPAVDEGRFVVECEGKEDISEEERRVEYQSALSKVLLMDLQSPEPGGVALASRKLEDFFLSEEHSKYTDCFCALGGQGLLLMLLQKWQDNQFIEERLFSCLSNLCMWAGENSPNVLSTVLIMRGMDLIADSMKRFPESGKLYVDCLVTITCLCRKEELDRHATTRASITGAVPLVCKAIKAFPENRDVLLSGCRALKAFCEMKLDQIKDLKGEAISVVGASLQNFPDDTEINTIAFSFLFNLGSMCGYGAGNETETKEEEKKVEKNENKAPAEPVKEESSSPPPVRSKPVKKWGGGSLM